MRRRLVGKVQLTNLTSMESLNWSEVSAICGRSNDLMQHTLHIITTIVKFEKFIVGFLYSGINLSIVVLKPNDINTVKCF